MHEIKLKRIYQDPADEDGKRVLVDRLWPRGVSKERAHLDAWWKDLAPSPELRVWFGHKEERFEEFGEKYRQELDASDKIPPYEEEIKKDLKKDNVTFLYAAKSEEINHARILKAWMDKQIKESEK
jgi:uncharacterized protein YeaO (DUF488 family)